MCLGTFLLIPLGIYRVSCICVLILPSILGNYNYVFKYGLYNIVYVSSSLPCPARTPITLVTLWHMSLLFVLYPIFSLSFSLDIFYWPHFHFMFCWVLSTVKLINWVLNFCCFIFLSSRASTWIYLLDLNFLLKFSFFPSVFSISSVLSIILIIANILVS